MGRLSRSPCGPWALVQPPFGNRGKSPSHDPQCKDYFPLSPEGLEPGDLRWIIQALQKHILVFGFLFRHAFFIYLVAFHASVKLYFPSLDSDSR